VRSFSSTRVFQLQANLLLSVLHIDVGIQELSNSELGESVKKSSKRSERFFLKLSTSKNGSLSSF
jgi:hypothetical protein